MRIQTFLSSLYMASNTLAHLCFISKKVNKPLLLFHCLGVTTSLLNHGTNTKIFRTIDRLVMIVGSGIDLYYCKMPEEYFLLASSISCYFISKLTNVVFFHNLSHIAITTLHNIIIY